MRDSFELTLPTEIMDRYQVFKSMMMWYDDAIVNPAITPDETLAIIKERGEMISEFQKRFADWGRRFLEPEAAPFHAAPAPAVSRPSPAPPPPLPASVRYGRGKATSQ